MQDLPYRQGNCFAVTVNPTVSIKKNDLVAVDPKGYAITAADMGAKLLLGCAENSVDNSVPTAEPKQVVIARNRHFLLANDSANPVTQADIGKPVTIAAANTVSTSQAGKLIVGVCMGIAQNGGVWVDISGVPTGVMPLSTSSS